MILYQVLQEEPRPPPPQRPGSGDLETVCLEMPGEGARPAVSDAGELAETCAASS
jgi:hypothetical protein